ncbi:MAG TPA: hypothetical protein PKN50_21330, partial [Spirochaetota bacterium]|nr:hypothetical protein [Spirochaetota bacterium]
MKRGTIKVFSIFIFLILASLALLVPEHSLSASRKPLFIQVHVTNSLGNISSAQLKRILAGEVANFRDIGGRNMPVRIYVDSEIAKKVIKEYPGLNCRVQSFNREYLASERGFLGISDLRGLRPCFKVLYIDKTLPWG